MTEHEFTLVIDADLADETSARALFEAGCDDATFGVVDGVGYGEFLREAPSFAAAVLSAVDQVESIQGLQVMRVEPDDIVTMAEIGDRLDRTRESVRLLVAGQRGLGGVPRPMSHSRERGRLWRWSDVADWLGQLDPEQRESAHFVAALNAALGLRRQAPAMADHVAVEHVLSLAS